MATPIREQFLEALKSKMSGITAFNSPEAQRANSELDVRSLPAIVIWDGNDGQVETDQSYNQVAVATQVGVETVHHANDDYKTWSTQANDILAELVMAATGGDRSLGGLVDDVRYLGTTIYYPEAGSGVIGVDLILEVKWRHDIGDPYTNSMM